MRIFYYIQFFTSLSFYRSLRLLFYFTSHNRTDVFYYYPQHFNRSSIGTNPLLNLILQASFWTLLISFIKPKGEIIKLSSIPTHYISIGLASLLIFAFIFVEKRFYQATFYQLDIYDRRYAIILVLASFFVVKNLIETCIPRIYELIYFLPHDHEVFCI